MIQLRRTFSFARSAVLIIIAGIFFGSGAACGGGGGGSGGGSNIPTDPSGGSNSGGNTGGTNKSVSVTNNTYTPGATTIARGGTVQWTWNTCSGDGYTGSQCVAHSVTFDDGPTSALQEEGSFSRTFNAAGTYKYHCASHGLAMSGQVTVE